jgi:ABC-type transport system involved in multi-copper enzyme maturation permease subunit
VSDALSILFGPLARPECARAARPGWLIWVRMILAFAAGSVAFGGLWFWWMSQQIIHNSTPPGLVEQLHLPFTEVRTALTVVEGLLVGFAMALAPAVLAGSLAGEKERGSIGLLLTTRVNALEIVLGRLAGRLSQVTMVGMAALPILLLIAWTAGFGWLETLAVLALPIGVAIGNGGIALAASALSRRGRDALLLVYLIDLLVLLGPVLEAYGVAGAAALSPFSTLPELTWRDQVGPALVTAGGWSMMGLVGLALASWRLRPSCLAQADGSKSRSNARRRWRVPPVDDRPMLWKELYIERVGNLGRAGRWIGVLLVLAMGGGGLMFAGFAAWGTWAEPDSGWFEWSVRESSVVFGGTAWLVGILIPWAIGLRAAVTIASERERGTWDALLTSPLEGGEIVRGKLWGSLNALRWLVAAALLAWTVTAAIGGMFPGEYARNLVDLAVFGTFMAAVGVRASLQVATSTKAMAATIGVWCGAYFLGKGLAGLITLLIGLACVLLWMAAVQMGLASMTGGPWFPMSFRLGFDLIFYSMMISTTSTIIGETRLRFDRIAGRMTGGEKAIAIDRMIHGKPMAPVYLDQGKKAPTPELDEVAG